MSTERTDGRVIAGRYRLEALLGRGGMGLVWRATDQLLRRRVAVKEIAQDASLSPEESRRQCDRILREARAVARLSHPHVIVVHDVVVHDERPYIVMELIDGGSLADRISAQGPVDAYEAARIGVHLLGALRTAHAAGVLHRDLKPANVLIESGTGRVVLTDFGVAQVPGATTLTESGSFVGSPEYTAPERMSGPAPDRPPTCGRWASCCARRSAAGRRSTGTPWAASCTRWWTTRSGRPRRRRRCCPSWRACWSATRSDGWTRRRPSGCCGRSGRRGGCLRRAGPGAPRATGW
ncbi:Serine/threonine-protein kinase PknD [Streptomyces glaucescens]